MRAREQGWGSEGQPGLGLQGQKRREDAGCSKWGNKDASVCGGIEGHGQKATVEQRLKFEETEKELK